MGSGLIIRGADPGDAAALAAIYGHHVVHGTGTFEEQPPTPVEMEARRIAVTARGMPYFVAEQDGQVRGFAYAAPFRQREAYRYTVEDSVYVAPDAIGRGIGRAALEAVLAVCEAMGMRQAVAMIGGSDNIASIALHRRLGFEHVGVGRNLGFKQGRWIDVVWMQKALGDRATNAGVSQIRARPASGSGG